ncbi:hypothetical protein MAJHIDBO_00633 [Propionibacterium freudenreichii subsp. shermanii]|nr:hypothetical protein MAJHIDBO_00633 [Propionibacterium freudenreichii subsp. shermanii]SPS08449.1 hypothetical protein MAJHIDBO_00633 [Propionibacterium freudenreichii subsp. shermanii]
MLMSTPPAMAAKSAASWELSTIAGLAPADNNTLAVKFATTMLVRHCTSGLLSRTARSAPARSTACSVVAVSMVPVVPWAIWTSVIDARFLRRHYPDRFGGRRPDGVLSAHTLGELPRFTGECSPGRRRPGQCRASRRRRCHAGSGGGAVRPRRRALVGNVCGDVECPGGTWERCPWSSAPAHDPHTHAAPDCRTSFDAPMQ